MLLNLFLARRRQRGRLSSYRPTVWLLEDRSLPSFLGPASYAVPGDASDVAIGDFNGDGVPDMAVTNSRTGSVSILLGRGDGTFQDAVSYAAGVNPGLVVVGDFNGDGIPDLAITGFSYTSTDTVRILLGNGDGTFRPPVSYVCGARPVGLVAGDFTGDGVLDLAVANEDGVSPDYRGSVHVLLGNGDGSFRPPVTYAAGVLPFALVEGDFTGAGILDLAVANEGLGTAGTGSSISVLLGNGDGSFQPAVDNAPGLQAQSLAVGDLTGNGLPDLIIGRSASTLVTVLHNRGDGSFEAAGSFATGGDPTAIAVGDFTGDGIPDLAVANNTKETLSVLPGNGDGTFRPPVVYAAGYQPGRMAVVDFNSDGLPDIAMTNTLSNSVSVFLSRGDGTFVASVEMNPGTVTVAGGDFNGDGITDLVTPNFDNPGTVSILLGNGDGTFQPPVRYAVGPDPEAVAVGDFNGDGIPDLAVVDANAPLGSNGFVSILLGRGDGTFEPAVDYAVGAAPRPVVIGDFNGDGIPDIAVANNASVTISVLLGRGDGTFAPAVTTRTSRLPLSLAAGDFNGDGITDLVGVSQGSFPDYIGIVSVFLGNGDGTFRGAVDYSAEMRSGFVAVADFNGDGIPDLAVSNYTAGTMGIWLGNGDGTFRPSVDYAASPFARSVVVADFNGDGFPDLAVSGANAITILLGRGDGTFAPPLNYLSGKEPGPLVVGDFNGDGFPDLATRNEGGLIVLFNAGDWGPAAAGALPRGRAHARARALPLQARTPGWIEVSTAPLVSHDQQTTVQHLPAAPPTHAALPAPMATMPHQAGRHDTRSAPPAGAARLDEDTALPGWDRSMVDWLGESGTPIR